MKLDFIVLFPFQFSFESLILKIFAASALFIFSVHLHMFGHLDKRQIACRKQIV